MTVTRSSPAPITSGLSAYSLALAAARRLDVEGFAAAFPHPALLVQRSHRGPGQDGFDTCKAAPPAGMVALGVIEEPSLCWVRKSPSARTFVSMITVGRSPTNDLVLDAPGVSKVHAFFASDPEGGITLVDAGSSYGTRVGQTNLRPRTQKVTLQGGELLVIGGVQAYFHTPGTLHALLRPRELSARRAPRGPS